MEMRKRHHVLEGATDNNINEASQACEGDVFTLAPSRTKRPMHSTHMFHCRVSASGRGDSKKRKLSPLLTNFFSAIGRLPDTNHDDDTCSAEADKEASEDREKDSNTSKEAVAKVDDCSFSMVPPGKHQRYKSLLVSSKQNGGLNPLQRKEFKKLDALVKEEQEIYRQALREFWDQNKERVLIGFSKSSRSSQPAKFAEMAVDNISLQANWYQLFKKKTFGKCIQMISLEQSTSRQTKKARVWTVDEIESQDLSLGYIPEFEFFKTTGTLQALGLPKVGSQVLPQHVDGTGSSLLLKDDKNARRMAKLNNVQVVATLEALETILDLEETNWMLPVSFHDGVAMVDVPAPRRFLSPRARLTRGFERGLMSSLISQDQTGIWNKEKEEDSYRYILLSFPKAMMTTGSSFGGRKRKMRVLVRVPKQSTRARAHLEYFPERGEEIASTYERSLWILDSYLFARSVVGRIDPSSCRVLKWEETSVAHALATTDDETTTHYSAASAVAVQDPIVHWDCLARLLQAIPSIGHKGNFLLCSPGRDHASVSSLRSVSIHMEADGTQGIIQLEQELLHSGEVNLGSEAIQRSLRDWRWCQERIPYTFPTSPATTWV